jgi:uncharacterized membrane protein
MERPLEWILLTWGLLWWFGAVLTEISTHTEYRLLITSNLIGMTLSTCLIAILARRWDWHAMQLATIPIGPILWLLLVPFVLLEIGTQSLSGMPDRGWLGWGGAVATSYLLVFWFERAWPPVVVRLWHAGAAWSLLLLTAWILAVAVRRLVPESPIWSLTLWCLVPAAAVILLGRAGRVLVWPVQRFESLYAGVISLGAVAAVLLWVAFASVSEGSAEPLPYIPILNPLELTQALGLAASYAWVRRSRADGSFEQIEYVSYPLLGAIAFIALNMVVARAVHFYLDVPFTPQDLTASPVFHAGISILWGLTAGALMTVARRKLVRPVWITGAGLLALLIVKLFLVDLGNVDGLARIVSFLAAGVLILAIGYFAPAPPKDEQAS